MGDTESWEESVLSKVGERREDLDTSGVGECTGDTNADPEWRCGGRFLGLPRGVERRSLAAPRVRRCFSRSNHTSSTA